MAVRFTDAEIAELLAEPKSLPDDYRARLQLRPRSGHQRADLDVQGPSGNRFRILLRQNTRNALDFSAIVVHAPADSNLLFRLRRYNGRSHEHTNRLEGTTFYDFHIHMATERYQDLGAKEDSFAEPSDRFADLRGALACLLEDCAFRAPDAPQLPLFQGPPTP
jgi:hypothetical protein